MCWWDFETIAAAEIDADKSLDFHLSPSDEAVVGEGVVVKAMVRGTGGGGDHYLIHDASGALWRLALPSKAVTKARLVVVSRAADASSKRRLSAAACAS